MKRLAIITTHPIQYNAPLFSLLTTRGNIAIKVFYTWGDAVLNDKYDPGFQKTVQWDIDLLTGYDHQFVKNISPNPGSSHYKGIDNPSLNAEVDAWQPDAIMIFGWKFKSHLKAIRYYKGKIPVIFRGDSTLLDEAENVSFKKVIRRRILKWVYKHADLFLYVGQANKDYFLKHGVSSTQLVYAPHAVDNERFTTGNSLRESLGIPANAIVFLFTGKLEEKKDPFLLLNAFLKVTDSDTYLLFAGSGSLENNLKAATHLLPDRIKNRIIFMGFQNQQIIPSVYKTADVVVLPSKGPGETWGLSVNEAMAAGKPVIVTDKCGCAKDLVIQQQTGYVFNARNETQLLQYMNKFINEPSQHMALGGNAMHHIQKFSFESNCKAIENIMNKHISGIVI